jgi:hypothetical protein
MLRATSKTTSKTTTNKKLKKKELNTYGDLTPTEDEITGEVRR